MKQENRPHASPEPLTPNDALKLTSLDASDSNITNLSGLEYFTNLNYLSLERNNINDISPLSRLYNLNSLYLSNNSISDIDIIANFRQLAFLYLDYNNITDISALRNFSLLYMHLEYNYIDISPGSQSYEIINSISRKYIWYSPQYAKVATPTVNQTNHEFNNSTITLSTLTNGATIRYTTDGSDPTSTSTIYTTPIEITSNTTIKAIASYPDMADSDIVTFSYTTPQATIIEFKDAKLEAAIRSELKISTGSITTEDAQRLTSLIADGRNITDLDGIEYFTNLTSLSLYGNKISNINPLAGLKELTSLTLWMNNIDDISALANLPKLTYLDLDTNYISDISTLANLSKLKKLYLDNNFIDVSSGSAAKIIIDKLVENGTTVFYTNQTK